MKLHLTIELNALERRALERHFDNGLLNRDDANRWAELLIRDRLRIMEETKEWNGWEIPTQDRTIERNDSA